MKHGSMLLMVVLAGLAAEAAEKSPAKTITQKQAIAIATAEVKKRERWTNTDARAVLLEGQWVVTVHQDANTAGVHRLVIISAAGEIVKYETGR